MCVGAAVPYSEAGAETETVCRKRPDGSVTIIHLSRRILSGGVEGKGGRRHYYVYPACQHRAACRARRRYELVQASETPCSTRASRPMRETHPSSRGRSQDSSTGLFIAVLTTYMVYHNHWQRQRIISSQHTHEPTRKGSSRLLRPVARAGQEFCADMVSGHAVAVMIHCIQVDYGRTREGRDPAL